MCVCACLLASSSSSSTPSVSIGPIVLGRSDFCLVPVPPVSGWSRRPSDGSTSAQAAQKQHGERRPVLFPRPSQFVSDDELSRVDVARRGPDGRQRLHQRRPGPRRTRRRVAAAVRFLSFIFVAPPRLSSRIFGGRFRNRFFFNCKKQTSTLSFFFFRIFGTTHLISYFRIKAFF